MTVTEKYIDHVQSTYTRCSLLLWRTLHMWYKIYHFGGVYNWQNIRRNRNLIFIQEMDFYVILLIVHKICTHLDSVANDFRSNDR